MKHIFKRLFSKIFKRLFSKIFRKKVIPTTHLTFSYGNVKIIPIHHNALICKERFVGDEVVKIMIYEIAKQIVNDKLYIIKEEPHDEITNSVHLTVYMCDPKELKNKLNI